MLHLAVLAALAYADEELKLRVNIPRLDETTMHERAFAEVGSDGDVGGVRLIVPKGQEPVGGAALKLCLKEVGPGAGLVDCVVQLAARDGGADFARGREDEQPCHHCPWMLGRTMGTFEHAEGADFAEEALSFVLASSAKMRSKSASKTALNLKAQARRKIDPVPEMSRRTRDGRPSNRPWTRPISKIPTSGRGQTTTPETVAVITPARATQCGRSVERLHLLVHRRQ